MDEEFDDAPDHHGGGAGAGTDADGGADGAVGATAHTYSLPPSSACTALCVLCELLHQRGYDVVRVGDADITGTDAHGSRAAPPPAVGAQDAGEGKEDEGGDGDGGNDSDEKGAEEYYVPRADMLDTATDASADAGGRAGAGRPRCAPAVRPLDDRVAVRFPPRVRQARDVLRALGDAGIMTRTQRVPGEPLVVARAPDPVPAHCTAFVHGAAPGDEVMVFAPCAERKVLIKTTRHIVEASRVASRRLAARGNALRETIVVHSGAINAYARNEMSAACVDDGLVISEFAIRELQANITSHQLVPLHVPVMLEEVARAMRSLGILEHNVEEISEEDMVARALGLRPGNFVRIRRHGYEGASTVMYRRVTHRRPRPK